MTGGKQHGNADTSDDFIIEHAGHMTGSRWEENAHFPGTGRARHTDFWRPMAGRKPVFLAQSAGIADPADAAIAEMNAAGVDLAFIVVNRYTFLTDGQTPMDTNGRIARLCERYPERLFIQPNFHPSKLGIEQALREMEYFARERGCKYVQLYPPDETMAINDRRLWPFYAKAQELGLVLGVHTGLAHIYGGTSRNSHPLFLEEVCRDFYDLKIVAFHFGWPWHRELNALANTYPNLYIGMSYLTRAIVSRPRWFAEILGEAVLWASADKLIWGVGGYDMSEPVNGFRQFQFPVDMQQGHGYPPLSADDKAKIFGLNFARLVGIEPKKRVPR